MQPRTACIWLAECKTTSGIDKRAPPWAPAISGNWGGGFNNQGENGNFWSASAHPDNADNAFNANFNASEVNPADNNDRNMGASVR